MSITAILDDVAETECDAIVYSVDADTFEHGLADGSIVPAPGYTPGQETMILTNMFDGFRIEYAPSDLYSIYVIHSICPAPGADEEESRKNLVAWYKRCLELAADHECRSVAFTHPGDCSGHLIEEGVAAALTAIHEFPRGDSMDYEFYFQSEEEYQACLTLYPEMEEEA